LIRWFGESSDKTTLYKFTAESDLDDRSRR